MKQALDHQWHAFALSDEVKARPIKIIRFATPWVIWRGQLGQIGLLADHCPHRGAPLSMGKVEGGLISCPYHGWQFNGDGACVHMPAFDAPCGRFFTLALETCEADGLVFARAKHADGAPTAPRRAIETPQAAAFVTLSRKVKTSLADVAENALDTTHTSVLHVGYLRAAKNKRLIAPTFASGPDWIAAHYPPAGSPSGLMGFFGGGQAFDITDRFVAPAIAEIDYAKNGALKYGFRFHFTPAEDGYVMIHAAIFALGKGFWPKVEIGAIKLLLAKVFDEDVALLEAVANNRPQFPQGKNINTPADILRAGIEAILQGKSPTLPVKPTQFWV